jgi:hypothetical protein
VIAGSTGHGIDEAVAIFVADGVIAIELKVFVGAEVIGNGNHG